MSFNNTKIKSQSERGFTIVELLIVIVVIGILAAITIVSFNGVTAKANTTSAKAAASTVLKKAEAYNASENTNGYPATLAVLKASPNETYGVTGVTIFPGTTTNVAPDSPSFIKFYTCGSSAGTQVAYFDYSTKLWVTQTTGTCAAPITQTTT